MFEKGVFCAVKENLFARNHVLSFLHKNSLLHKTIEVKIYSKIRTTNEQSKGEVLSSMIFQNMVSNILRMVM